MYSCPVTHFCCWNRNEDYYFCIVQMMETLYLHTHTWHAKNGTEGHCIGAEKLLELRCLSLVFQTAGCFFVCFFFFFGTTLRVKHLFLLCVHICSFGLWCVWTTVICQRMRIHTSWTGEPVIKTRQICDCHERRESAWGTPLSERDCQRRKCTFLLCLHTLWSFN